MGQAPGFGHSHFTNSLMWGENLHDIAIVGRGVIYGKGLTRQANRRKATRRCRSNCAANVLIRDV